MRKLLLLLFTVLLTSLSGSAFDFKEGNIYYDITGSNTVKVTYVHYGSSGYDYYGYSGDVNIPSSVTHNGTTYQVTAIGHHAFYNCPDLTSVSIPNTVTSIGYDAFIFCTGLSLMTIPNSVTDIESEAFYGCSGMRRVVIGSGVTYIGQYAFCDCYNLNFVECLASTPPTMAASNVFDDAVYSNATLYVPKGCKSAYQSADGWSQFTNIRELSYSFEVDGIYYNITGTYTVQVTFRTTGYNSYSGNVTIPSSVTYNGITYQVTAIYLNAFRNCSNLTSVTIPNSVTTIGANAFNNCSSLTSITIPSSVTTIGNYAFANSNALTSVTCYALTPPSMSNAFSSTVYSNATLYVPKGCKSAYQSANGWSQFITIQELTYSFEVDGIYYEITGTRSVKVTYKSGYNTYSGKVVIPAKVTHSGNTYTVTSIGATAFLNSVNLTSVVIPSTVTTIGSGAFRGCTGLTSVNCRATTPPTLYSDESFSATTYSNATLYVPLQGSDLYHQADGWKNFTQMYIRDYDFIDNGIAYRIGGNNTVSVTIKDFSYNGDHQEFYSGDVVIPGTVRYDGNTYRVTHIGGLAFVSCPSLTNLTLPETVSYIRSWAVMGNPNLKSLTCLAPVPPTLEDEAFGGSATYSEFSLFVPDASIQSYRDDGNWGQFTTIRPSLDYALNVGSGTVKFTSTGDYPWTNVVEGDRVYAISGNKGRHSTTSTMTATVTVGSGGSVSFEYKAWGESPSYDVCIFSVDGNQKFSYSNKQNEWVNYTVQLTAGTHTLTWTYAKDGSVNPTGDYFAIDNVVVTGMSTPGDVDGDGNVSIADVTELIDLILIGSATIEAYPAADVDGDGRITIADATALIDTILGGN